MKYFFSQIEDVSLEPQVSAEVYFRGANATGLIEKHLDAEQIAFLFFVNGEPRATYLIRDGQCKPISLTEFSALNEENTCVTNLPDVAGRLTLLALESQAGNRSTIDSDQAWENQCNQWRQERWNGLVEVKSRDVHGFILFWEGEIQKSDLIFSTSGGFVRELPSLSGASDPVWQMTAYSHTASTQSYQCTILRQAAMHWSRAILSRYQEMVGQKLLQMMDRELNRQIQPWRWNIVLDGKDMLDLHFFPYLKDAAHAYRALFMAMGAQMDFVIGNHLTQKLLSETFEQVYPDERVVLQTQRLVPAAFSE